MKIGLVIGVILVICLFTLFVTDLVSISRTHWSPVAVLLNTSLSPSTCNNQDMEDVSLFYRIDIKAESNQSIKGSPTEHLSNYKNPCWYGRLSEAFPYKSNKYQTISENYGDGSIFRANGTFQNMSRVYDKRLKNNENWRLRCLPYIYLIGVTKSGTSDLFAKIVKHPDVVPGALKEPMWWNRRSIGRERRLQVIPFSFSDYVDLYDGAAETIRTSVIKPGNETEYHQKVTIDATPAYLWDYDGWQMIPGNMGQQEPRYIMAHSLKAIVPQAKIIAILRHPVDRLYSQFRMKSGKYTPSGFHLSAADAVDKMSSCLQKRTLRHCVYNTEIVPTEFKPSVNILDLIMEKNDELTVKHGSGYVFLRASLYYVYIADWLSVFPRDQFLVIRAEDYYNNRSSSLADVYHFLGLRPMDSNFMHQIAEEQVINSAPPNGRPMLERTRIMLSQFFQPYNKLLAQLLNNTAFLWDS